MKRNRERPLQLRLEGTQMLATPKPVLLPRGHAPLFRLKTRTQLFRRAATDRVKTLVPTQSPVKTRPSAAGDESSEASDNFFSSKNSDSRLLQLLEEYRKRGQPELRLLTAAGARLSF